jgi:trimethylamine--corrinoid protein Co-methyltransferase
MDVLKAAFHSPNFKILSQGQIEQVYQATLVCLQQTGVEVNNQEALALLGDAGADIDGNRARISAPIIENAVAQAPSSFKICGRESQWDMAVEPGQVHFGPGPTCTYYMDPKTGERRKAERQDPATTAHVCDALDHIDYVMSLGLIDNVTASLASVHEFAQMITHTKKPVLAWAFELDHLEAICQIAESVAGGWEAFCQRPNFGFFSTWQAPLIHTDKDLANCFLAVEKGIPVIYLGGGVAGLSGPITGAGLMVTNLACMLSGLAILQLKKPGTPVCLGALPAPMDLRTARLAYGGPEMSLYSAAISEVTHFLGIPYMGTAGASESKEVDLQAAIESTLQVVLSQMSKVNMVHDVGFLDCADIGSLEMLVMTNEIICLARRIATGIEINPETLMLDLIDEIGPGGNFIMSPQTATRCRQEILTPELMDRNACQIWEENGSATMLERIRQKLSEILSKSSSVKLPTEVHDRINKIIENAENKANTHRFEKTG